MKTITLKQIDGHYGKVIGTEEQIMDVWEALSYEKIIKLKYKPRPEKVTFSLLDRRNNKFPYGLIDFILEKLDGLGYETVIQEIDKTLKTIKNPKLNGITFEDYQIKVIDSTRKNKRGIFIAPTASGKSAIAAGIIAKLNFPIALITTINKTIFNQFYKDFCKWFPDIEIGRVGDGHCDISHITIGLYQSVAKYDLRKYNKICNLWLADEVHAASSSLSKISKQLTNVHYRYGLTATTQKYENNKQAFLEMTGNIGSSLKELEDDVVKSRVVSCDVYMVNFLCKEPQGKNYHGVFRNDICLSEKRNIKLLKAAKYLAINKGKTVLFLVDEISQAEQVGYLAAKMGIKNKIAHGRKHSKINEQIKETLEDKKIKLVIATGIFKTGTNIVSLDCLVLGSARKSEISILQSIGRARRVSEGKDKAIIIDSYDTVIGKQKYHSYFLEYSKKRIELYKEKGWFKKRLLL